MKSRFSSAIAILLIAAFLTSSIAYIKPVLASPQNDVTLSPNANNFIGAPVGTLFNVTVSISNNSTTLGGVNIGLYFDDSILMVTKWAVPDGINGAPLDPNFFMPLPDAPLPGPPNPGYIHKGPNSGECQVAVSKGGSPPQPPWGGSGVICIFEFNITAIPAKLGSLSSVLGINNVDTFAIDQAAGSLITNPVDGSYSNVWAAPAAPHMGLTPTSTTFGPNPPSAVNQTFTEKLYIRSLSPAWYLTAASFDFNYNSTIIEVLGAPLANAPLANITIDPLWTMWFVSYVPGIPWDTITISVSMPNPPNPSGDVLVATLNFTVMMQQVAPPFPTSWVDVSPLMFCQGWFENHVGPIPWGEPDSGTVTVKALRTLKLPWLEVRPASVVMGPAPVIGDTFTVAVWVTGPPPELLDQSWFIIGSQFRLFFDPTLITPVAIDEGTFFKNPTWNLHGTFFTGTHELDGLGEHVLVGNMLLPNSTGYYDQTVWPHGEGPIAFITFEILWQQCPNNASCTLELTPLFQVDEWFINKDGNWVEAEDPVNGLYTILPFDMPGRVLDVYGGANNRGYWAGYPDPFPLPYGGQGPNHWMDIVFPQSEVTFYAYLTYNYWPVQAKDIGFEIEGPFDKDENGTLVPRQTPYQFIWAKLTATTGQDGIAVLTYRMPWPCDNPDIITGIWKVTATATVADVTLMDTVIFYYERLVYITKVTTDSFYYIHGQDVTITVDYETHSVMLYPTLFSVTITDDLGVPFGFITYAKMVGGATFCTWKTGRFIVTITIPKWAYAGYGLVHVDAFDKDPTDGGFAWCPEFTPAPQIQIGPY
jgi:hypothetical protein